MIKYLFIIVIAFSGCSTYVVCPAYPKPSQGVLTEIKSLSSSDVDSWMSEQYKLNKKLKECTRW
jgi:hypothetical protein